MSYSENVLEEVIKISQRDGSNLFEALATFCEEHGEDPEELVENLDKGVIEQIKVAAAKGRHVRKSVYKVGNTLPL